MTIILEPPRTARVARRTNDARVADGVIASYIHGLARRPGDRPEVPARPSDEASRRHPSRSARCRHRVE